MTQAQDPSSSPLSKREHSSWPSSLFSVGIRSGSCVCTGQGGLEELVQFEGRPSPHPSALFGGIFLDEEELAIMQLSFKLTHPSSPSSLQIPPLSIVH